MRFATLLLLLLALPCLLSAQITFQRTYGGADWDDGYSVAQTADGGRVIAGPTESFGAGSQDVYFIRLSSGNSSAPRKLLVVE